MLKFIFETIDILYRGTNHYLQYGGRHSLAVYVSGLWLAYQMILHLWLAGKVWRWFVRKIERWLER